MPQDKPKKKQSKGLLDQTWGELAETTKRYSEYIKKQEAKKYKRVASGIKSRMKTGGKMYKSFK